MDPYTRAMIEAEARRRGLQLGTAPPGMMGPPMMGGPPGTMGGHPMTGGRPQTLGGPQMMGQPAMVGQQMMGSRQMGPRFDDPRMMGRGDPREAVRGIRRRGMEMEAARGGIPPRMAMEAGPRRAPVLPQPEMSGPFGPAFGGPGLEALGMGGRSIPGIGLGPGRRGGFDVIPDSFDTGLLAGRPHLEKKPVGVGPGGYMDASFLRSVRSHEVQVEALMADMSLNGPRRRRRPRY